MKSNQVHEKEDAPDHVELGEEAEDADNARADFFRLFDETLTHHSNFWREIQKNKKRMEVIEESFVRMEETLEMLNYTVEDLECMEEFGPLEKKLYNDFVTKVYSSDEELAELNANKQNQGGIVLVKNKGLVEIVKQAQTQQYVIFKDRKAQIPDVKRMEKNTGVFSIVSYSLYALLSIFFIGFICKMWHLRDIVDITTLGLDIRDSLFDQINVATDIDFILLRQFLREQNKALDPFGLPDTPDDHIQNQLNSYAKKLDELREQLEILSLKSSNQDIIDHFSCKDGNKLNYCALVQKYSHTDLATRKHGLGAITQLHELSKLKDQIFITGNKTLDDLDEWENKKIAEYSDFWVTFFFRGMFLCSVLVLLINLPAIIKVRAIKKKKREILSSIREEIIQQKISNIEEMQETLEKYFSRENNSIIMHPTEEEEEADEREDDELRTTPIKKRESSEHLDLSGTPNEFLEKEENEIVDRTPNKTLIILNLCIAFWLVGSMFLTLKQEETGVKVLIDSNALYGKASGRSAKINYLNSVALNTLVYNKYNIPNNFGETYNQTMRSFNEYFEKSYANKLQSLIFPKLQVLSSLRQANNDDLCLLDLKWEEYLYFNNREDCETILDDMFTRGLVAAVFSNTWSYLYDVYGYARDANVTLASALSTPQFRDSMVIRDTATKVMNQLVNTYKDEFSTLLTTVYNNAFSKYLVLAGLSSLVSLIWIYIIRNISKKYIINLKIINMLPDNILK